MRLLLLLFFLAVALVAQAPAWLLATPLRNATSGIVELRRFSGTLWNGAADLALVTTLPAKRETGAGRIAWSVRRIDPSTPSMTVDLNQIPPNPKPLTIIASSDERLDMSGTFRIPLQAIGMVPMLADGRQPVTRLPTRRDCNGADAAIPATTGGTDWSRSAGLPRGSFRPICRKDSRSAT